MNAYWITAEPSKYSILSLAASSFPCSYEITRRDFRSVLFAKRALILGKGPWPHSASLASRSQWSILSKAICDVTLYIKTRMSGLSHCKANGVILGEIESLCLNCMFVASTEKMTCCGNLIHCYVDMSQYVPDNPPARRVSILNTNTLLWRKVAATNSSMLKQHDYFADVATPNVDFTFWNCWQTIWGNAILTILAVDFTSWNDARTTRIPAELTKLPSLSTVQRSHQRPLETY